MGLGSNWAVGETGLVGGDISRVQGSCGLAWFTSLSSWGFVWFGWVFFLTTLGLAVTWFPRSPRESLPCVTASIHSVVVTYGVSTVYIASSTVYIGIGLSVLR